MASDSDLTRLTAAEMASAVAASVSFALETLTSRQT